MAIATLIKIHRDRVSMVHSLLGILYSIRLPLKMQGIIFMAFIFTGCPSTWLLSRLSLAPCDSSDLFTNDSLLDILSLFRPRCILRRRYNKIVRRLPSHTTDIPVYCKSVWSQLLFLQGSVNVRSRRSWTRRLVSEPLHTLLTYSEQKQSLFSFWRLSVLNAIWW